MKSKVQSECYDLFLDWKVNLSRGCDISAFSMVFYSIAEHGQTGHNKASSDIKLINMIAAFSYKDFFCILFSEIPIHFSEAILWQPSLLMSSWSMLACIIFMTPLNAS